MEDLRGREQSSGHITDLAQVRTCTASALMVAAMRAHAHQHAPCVQDILYVINNVKDAVIEPKIS